MRHAVVSQAKWFKACRVLLAKEKVFTRRATSRALHDRALG
jgi:predicted dithiol-disulfide oxidoreductase (DUF899 family)